MRTLTGDEARRFYDRFGSRQDRQVFYEGRALATLVSHAQLDAAQAVFELGCGTGRFARELLAHHLPANATYLGVDISRTMVELATARLAAFVPRARVEPIGARQPLPVPAAGVDRFLSTYVLDLLSEDDIRHALAEAHRMLVPGGLLCLAGITHGTTLPSRLVMGAWQWVFRRDPSWVGGCRPLHAANLIAGPSWQIRQRTVVVAWGVASEVVVASRLGAPGVAG